MDKFNYWLPLSKVDKTAEGHRIVTGYASTPCRDLDGEVITLDAVKSALSGYMEWRNIRQMHQPVAVGITKEASIDEKGLYITGKIVDAGAIKLLDEGVLKGFSIGGKKLAKKGDQVTSIEMVEISLVDRPANPECRIDAVKSASGKFEMFGPDSETTDDSEVGWFRKVFERALLGGAPPVPMNKSAPANELDPEYTELLKREFSQNERQDATASGEAMPGGGYPIKTTQDLKNAIQAFGRAKDKEATKKHIMKRAKALGAMDQLPEGWASETTKSAEVADLLKAHPGLFGLDVSTPKLEAFAKTAEAALVLKVDVRERLAKGCGVVADLAYAFENIRSAQRRLVSEGFMEKDGDDHGLAKKLGEIASELATVMATKAQHEGSEAVFMTDEGDMWALSNGVFEMNDKTGDLAKAAKGLLGKTAHHLRKAGAAQAAGMACLGEMAKMHGAFVQKAAGAFDHAAAMKKAAEANTAFTEASDHMEMAHVGLASLANGTVTGSYGVTAVTEGTRTEGEVPWYSATEPYGKSAAAAAASGTAADEPKTFTQEQVDALMKTARLEAENATLRESLSKSPSSPFKARTLMPDVSGGENGDNLSALLKGVGHVDQNDPKSVQDAASLMITNMITNPQRFGKSVFDSSFKGQAGKKL